VLNYGVKLHFLPVKTRVFCPPKDEIWGVLDKLKLKNGDIVFITSKVLAIHQGRCVKKSEANKTDLIKREASHYLDYRHPSGHDINLTITNNILIAAAGIDESNANDHYILWPKDVDKLCFEIREYLCKRNKICNLGVVSTDSHTTPLRWGVTGITTGLAGLNPLRDIRGTKDIFGRELKLTQVNLIDPLSALAVSIMGESNEQTPIVILRGYKNIPFNEKGSMKDFVIPPDWDMYMPLLKAFATTKKKS